MQDLDITTISGSELPDELSRLHKPPAALNTLGNKTLLSSHPRVGIVGARKFTPYGKEVTENIAASLARAGVTVVSGLALGVDSIAHKACLDSGGHTIAVLPSGLKSIYPASHFHLAKKIIQNNGLLISEYPEKFKPLKVSFLERNRIIAALSDVLVITEAAYSSGSLNTAGYALDMGIPIMAVPGNITSPYSAGTNNLIKSGAHPLISPEDVFNILGINPSEALSYIPENADEKNLLGIIKSGLSNTNDLIKASSLNAADAQTTLTLLEIKGVVSVQAGQWYLK